MLETVAWRVSAKAVGYRLRNGSNRHPAHFYSSIARASFVVEGGIKVISDRW